MNEKIVFSDWQEKAVAEYAAANGLTGESLRFKTLIKNNNFRQVCGRVFLNATEQLTMCSITIVICTTLLLFFLNAIVRQIFVINFSVDSIAAAIAAVLLVSNLLAKYRLLKLYGSVKEYLILDAASVVLCILLKLWLPPNLDFSLIILVVSYFAQKRKFADRIKQLKKEYKIVN